MLAEFHGWDDEELQERRKLTQARLQEAEFAREAAQHRYSQIEGEMQDIGRELARRSRGKKK